MKKLIFSLLAATTPLLAFSSQNLLVNPGFNDTGDGLGSGWGSFGATNFNEFFGEGNPHASFFADNPGNSGGVFQTGIAATEGFTYTFNLTDFLVEENFGGTISVALEFFESDDTTKISEEVNTLNLVLSDPAPAPGSLSVTGSAPSGASFVRPLISFADADGSASASENFFVFEAEMTVIPEPATTALAISALALALVLIRRRCP